MRLPSWLRQHLAALRALLVLTVAFGVLYPLAITAVAQLPGLKDKANGSLVKTADGQVAGSAIIGQSFADADGNPLPQYFQSRPSAAGSTLPGTGGGYDPTATSASNLGPESILDTLPDPANKDDEGRQSLLTQVCARSKAVGELEGVNGGRPFCTASGSGLDPGISPAYARLQAARVAKARGITVDQVLALIEENTTGRTLGFMGEPSVNVLTLNLDLDREHPARG